MTTVSDREPSAQGPFDERFKLLLASGQATEATIRATRAALALVEGHYGIELDEDTGATLATHLATTTKRLLEGEVLYPLPDVARQEIAGFTEELRLAADVAAGLAKDLSISVPEDEVGFITIHLCTIRLKTGSARDK